MKLMKSALLFGLTLALALAVSATDTPLPGTETAAPTPALQPLTTEEPALEASEAEVQTALAQSERCPQDSAPLMNLDWMQGKQFAGSQTCGSCSSSNCNGATRGQLCYVGSGQGWGNCNIWLGNMCSTGGWKCVCIPSGGGIP